MVGLSSADLYKVCILVEFHPFKIINVDFNVTMYHSNKALSNILNSDHYTAYQN